MDSQMRQKPLSAVSKEDALIKTATPDKPGVEPCHPPPLNGSRLLGMKWQRRWKRKEEGGMLGGGSSALQQELGWAQRSHWWSKHYHRSLCPPLTLLDSALPFFHSLLLQGLQSPPNYSLCRRPGFSRHPPQSCWV